MLSDSSRCTKGAQHSHQNGSEEDDADLARRWAEEHPIAASSSAANAMFSEYLKVVRAKRAGTFVSYEDAKQDEPECHTASPPE